MLRSRSLVSRSFDGGCWPNNNFISLKVPGNLARIVAPRRLALPMNIDGLLFARSLRNVTHLSNVARSNYNAQLDDRLKFPRSLELVHEHADTTDSKRTAIHFHLEIPFFVPNLLNFANDRFVPRQMVADIFCTRSVPFSTYFFGCDVPDVGSSKCFSTFLGETKEIIAENTMESIMDKKVVYLVDET